MPWTLYRYILKDVLKLLMLATVALLLVFSFAAAIKPLSDGLFGPWTLIRFIFYTTPTMLTLVLPFAGAFAVTMVFCRAVTDNEITVCLGSGMSYRTILFPVLALGLIITLLLFYLGNWVVPTFYRKVAMVVDKDVTEVLMRKISKGQVVELRPGVVLYADTAVVSADIPLMLNRTLQPQQRIMVRGVVLGEFDTEGQLLWEATAEGADVYLFAEGGRSSIEIVFQSAMGYSQERGFVRLPGTVQSSRIALPGSFYDNPMFLSWPNLSRLAADPDQYDRIRESKLHLVREIAAKEVLNLISEALGPGGPGMTMLKSTESGESFYLTSPHLFHESLGLRLAAHDQAKVRMDISNHLEVSSRVEADTATIRIAKWKTKQRLIDFDRKTDSHEPNIDIVFEQPEVIDLTRHDEAVRLERFERRGRWPQKLTQPLQEIPVRELLDQVGTDTDPEIAKAMTKVHRHIERMNRKIISQINLRGAKAAAAVLFLLLGAVMSIAMSKSTPMIVYFWTFVIAMIVMVITHGGQNLVTDLQNHVGLGLSIIWLGDVLLTVILAVMYAVVARH